MNQFSKMTATERESLFWGNVDKRGEDECWEWKASRFTNGYGQTKLGSSGRGDTAHRVAMEYYSGGVIPKHLFVLHSCDNKPCCNPKHLRIGTHQENMDDREKSGLTCRGARHRWYGVPKTESEKALISKVQSGRRKHNAELIELIRSELGRGSQRELAKKHGVTVSYVQRIGANKI